MNYDAILIGFGQGANSLAMTLSANKWKVALIEKSPLMYGGSCINIGCIPTKILDYDAKRHTPYPGGVSRRHAVTEKKRTAEKEAMEDNDYVDLYTGTASFMDNHRVKVEMGNESVELTGERLFISTGSEPVFPPIEGLNEANGVYTSTSLQTIDELPQSLGIIGGGNIGLEFASIYSTYGSQVTVFENSSTFMEKEESDVAEEVKRALEEKGIAIHLGTSVEKVSNQKGKVVATADNGTDFTFDALLVASGRKPNTAQLGLENTAIDLLDNGGIKTDDFLKTSVEGVYALGDVRGQEQYTYITTADADIILNHLFDDGSRSLAQRKHVPYSIFVDPPFARVGLTEAEAKEQGFTTLTNTQAVAGTPRSAVIDDERGLFKAVVDADTRLILGATLFGDQAHELINQIKMAMDNDIPYTYLRDQLFTHPVMSEVFNNLFDM